MICGLINPTVPLAASEDFPSLFFAIAEIGLPSLTASAGIVIAPVSGSMVTPVGTSPSNFHLPSLSL